MTVPSAFEPPPYPYERLDELRALADEMPGGAIDLSIGTPVDPPPAEVVAALSESGVERGYPPSIGSAELRRAVSDWLLRRFGVVVDPTHVAACIGTKEFVGGTPGCLHLRDPSRDTVLHPALAYPTYEMGAILAGLRSLAVPLDDEWRLDVGQIADADAERAQCLWVNTPGNPAGGLDDLGRVVAWARDRGIPVLSDECYIEFTWADPYPGRRTGQLGRSALEHGTDGVIALHSLSKRSNLAGVRAGFYAGDGDLVHYLREVRKHAGFMPPGPVQHAAVVALADDDHVDRQRDVYLGRLTRVTGLLERYGLKADVPGGGFYLWVPAPAGDAWALTRSLARDLGLIVSPGEFYGEAGSGHVRVAMVATDERLDLLEHRVVKG